MKSLDESKKKKEEERSVVTFKRESHEVRTLKDPKKKRDTDTERRK